ncbi:hypothetical protein OBBRIDRAFT_815670 [Obba rivulosa]|uniref:Uncharacterized protein n=1 Tax=Obba rivulosa TaxID=1052685 RepID=A0A8E2DIM5_9APHY|nr:hypothetical protein OBBRIDRAFT_815670 [Obba rivulosa]
MGAWGCIALRQDGHWEVLHPHWILCATCSYQDTGLEPESNSTSQGRFTEVYVRCDIWWRYRRYKDRRTWRQRVERADLNWAPLLEHLADAYLTWRYTDRSAAEALTLHGYLATTPVSPSFAISFKTLELFRRLRLRKPSFSAEAFTKVICDFYVVCSQYCLHSMNSLANGRYHTTVPTVISEALGRNSPDWRVLNACLACCYELEDEPPLVFSRMVRVNGNNSLKHMAKVADRHIGDTRIFTDSDYFLSEEYINTFAHEVKARKRRSDPDGELAENPITEMSGDDLEEEGDPTDLAPETPGEKSCTDNWKAAADNLKKKMWGVFEETGIFACACRHGFILWIMDMIRSGELAKYPLAIVSKALTTLKGTGLLGYNIGCDFEVTIKRSSLELLWKKLGWHCCVNAFHGYSHNFRCQTRNHPNNITGMGLEDLETLKRVFSASNQLALIVRYASRYQQHDKYTNLATMLYNNVVQACEIIHTNSQLIAEALDSLGICEQDLEKWYTEETEYFATLSEEQPWDIHVMAYTERRHLKECRKQILCDLIEMEVHMGMQSRWQPTTPQYRATLQYVAMRDYHHALDNLQRLVIQRLFELHNLNLSQTGYRMRTHIAKSLQTRCKAIRNAVNAYNWAALALDPPRPTLDWYKVSHFSFLEKFNLLRDTKNDIHDKPWTRPTVHETMKKYHRLMRAREKLECCNVEVHRLHTAIEDETGLFKRVTDALHKANSPIYVNEHLLTRIHRIYKLDGFTGKLSRGRCKGAALSKTLEVSGSCAVQTEDEEEEIEDVVDEEDETELHIAGIVDYIAKLPTRT